MNVTFSNAWIIEIPTCGNLVGIVALVAALGVSLFFGQPL